MNIDIYEKNQKFLIIFIKNFQSSLKTFSVVVGSLCDVLRPGINGIQLLTNCLERMCMGRLLTILPLIQHSPVNSILRLFKTSFLQLAMLRYGSLQTVMQLLVVFIITNREKSSCQVRIPLRTQQDGTGEMVLEKILGYH